MRNNPLGFVDPTGVLIYGLNSKQYQNSTTNKEAYPGSSPTGFYNRLGKYIPNTMGRYGCLFTAAVNILNTVRGNQLKELGVPTNIDTSRSVASLSNKDSYFSFWLSKYNIGTDFGSGSEDIKELLQDMTGKDFSVNRIRTNKEAQHLIQNLGERADSADEAAFIIAEVTTDNGNKHFINITGYTEAGGLEYHDPYEGGTKDAGYTLADIKGAYDIRYEEKE